MRDEPDGGLKRPSARSSRSYKRCCLIKTAGRWPWKLASAKECVTTHLPNGVALKMDGAEAGRLNPSTAADARPRWVGGRGAPVTQRAAWAGVKRAPVQILVAVANIQMRTLKTEVEKGFLWTALGQEWVGPKRVGSSFRMAAISVAAPRKRETG